MNKLLPHLVGIWLVLVIVFIAYASSPIEEASPIFNCHLHGNQVCGNVDNVLGFIY